MMSLKPNRDYVDKVNTAASESMGEQVQVHVPCDENALSNPDSLAPQCLIPCSDASSEELNNTEDKESLVDRNLKDRKLCGYDGKRLSASIMKDVFKVVIGTTWSNIPCNKPPSSEEAPSACNVPTEGNPATQDSSEKQDTPTAEDSPATPPTETDELSTTDCPAIPPAAEIQGSPAMTQSNPDSVSDEEDGPSGEDVESSKASAGIRTTPCGEDQVPPASSDSKGMPDSVQREEAIASKPNEAPVGEGEADCGGPSQDESERSRTPLPQSDGSDIVCGQGKAPAITMGAYAGSKNLPTNTNSRFATTDVPLESVSDSDSVVGRPSLDDSATSLDAKKANITSTVSTESSQPSGGASEADVPCVDTPLSSVSDSCSVNTPAECHDELSDASEGGSPTGQEIAVTFDSSDSLPTDVNPDDDPSEHKATEIADTVDTCTGPESEECRPTAVPDGIAMGGAELACQPDGQSTTLVPVDDHTNSPAIKEADGKADDDSGSSNSVTNAVSSSSGLSPLFIMLIFMQFIYPVICQDEAVNFTSSNVTEVDSMAVENGNESLPSAGQSTVQGVYLIVAIGFAIELVCMSLFAHRHLIFFHWYAFILGVVVRACKNVRSCIKCVVKRRSDQVLPLTSATDIQNNDTNSEMRLVPPLNETAPPHEIETERSSSSVETLSGSVSEDMTLNGIHTQQSIESGYHSMTPAPHSRVALPSGKDGRIDREPLHSRLNQQGSRVQFQSTALDSIDISEPVCSPPPIGKKQRVDCSNNVECTEAENCDPGGEFVLIGFRKKESRTATSRWGEVQEVTQQNERSSELAGLKQQRRERTIQMLPPVVITNNVVPTLEPSPIQTVAVPIDPNVSVLALNATVDDVAHDAPEPPEDVLNVTPVTLESSFIDLEQGVRPHVGLADAEVDMFQLRPPLYVAPHAAQRDTADSAPLYPPLPDIPLGNAQLQPVFPPLPALPSTSTPMVIIPVIHVP
jgi:hypothetical protein